MKRPFVIVVGAASAILIANPAVAAPAPGPAQRQPARSIRVAAHPALAARAQASTASAAVRPSSIECQVSGGGRSNVNLGCDDAVLPNNEPHIAVNPARPNHLVASSNDYDDPSTSSTRHLTAAKHGSLATCRRKTLIAPGPIR